MFKGDGVAARGEHYAMNEHVVLSWLVTVVFLKTRASVGSRAFAGAGGLRFAPVQGGREAKNET